MQQDYRWEAPGLAFFNFILMEMGDFAMERRMLKGVKRRAESAVSRSGHGTSSHPPLGRRGSASITHDLSEPWR